MARALRMAVGVGAVGVFLSFSMAAQTDWTGLGGNGLWADPNNWTNGVPDASSYSSVVAPAGAIDLGGGTGSVRWLRLEGDGIRITNGTLATSEVFFNYNSPWSAPRIEANLTGVNGELHLGGDSRGVRVEGTVAGSIALGLWGGNTLASPTQHTGPTWFGTAAGAADVLAENGTLPQTSAIRVCGWAQLDNHVTNLPDRISDTAPVEFSGGRLSVWMAAGSTGGERIGAIHVTGNAELDMGSQGAFTLSAPSFTRDIGAVVYFKTDPSAGRKIIFDTAPALTGGILPYAGQTTYDTSADPLDSSHPVGIRPLAGAELAASIPAAGSPGPALNVWLATQQMVTGNVAVNSVAGQGIILDHATLNVESGYLGSAVTGTGTITAPDELVVDTRASTMTVPVMAKSLVFRGGYSNTVRLNAANNVTDRIVVGSNLFINHLGALGTAKLFLTSAYVNGTFSTLRVNDSMVLANDIQFGSENPVHQASAIRYGSPIYLEAPHNKTLTLSGNLTGDAITIGGNDGYLRIDGNAQFNHLILSGFQGVELNGTILGQLYPNGVHDANVMSHLYGNGTLLGIYSAGTASPGTRGGTGRLTVEGLTSFTYHCDLDGMVAGSQYDQLVLLGRFYRGYEGYTAPLLDVDLTFSPFPGTEFLIFDNQASDLYPDLFAGLPEGGMITANGVALAISYQGGDGNDIVLTVVPEPTASLAILGVGSLLMGRRARSRAV